MPTIQLEHAAKYYKWEKKLRAAVSGIDLTIRQGEFVSLIGSSGAGKSTLLKLITGELRPEEGAVRLDGLNLAKAPPWRRPQVRRMFGQVWQEQRLMCKRTVGENLSVIARITEGGHALDRRVEKALSLVGMSGAAEKYPGELSIGECRRVELARALINSPPILVLDEVTANLDEDNIWDILHLLMELNRQGTTVIMATHASTFVNILRRRVVTLVDGKIAADVKQGRYGDLTGKTLAGTGGIVLKKPALSRTICPRPPAGRAGK